MYDSDEAEAAKMAVLDFLQHPERQVQQMQEGMGPDAGILLEYADAVAHAATDPAVGTCCHLTGLPCDPVVRTCSVHR